MAMKLFSVFLMLFFLFLPMSALSEIQTITLEIEGMD